MATQEESNAKAELRQAQFMRIASIALAIIYVGFLAYRAAQGRPFGALSIIVSAFLVLGIVNSRKRYLLAKSAVAHSDSRAAA